MLPAIPPETASVIADTSEICFWESGDSGELFAVTPQRGAPALVPIEERVEKFVTLETDDPDSTMKELQDELRSGNRRVADMLATTFYERRFDAEARGLALETLAATRIRWYDSELLDLVRYALDASEPELQFAGIAAASDLSRTSQVALSRVIRSMLDTLSLANRGAAEAFLRRVSKVTSPQP